jgi:hypothetical protein
VVDVVVVRSEVQVLEVVQQEQQSSHVLRNPIKQLKLYLSSRQLRGYP